MNILVKKPIHMKIDIIRYHSVIFTQYMCMWHIIPMNSFDSEESYSVLRNGRNGTVPVIHLRAHGLEIDYNCRLCV